jgi:hypothetical protein
MRFLIQVPGQLILPGQEGRLLTAGVFARHYFWLLDSINTRGEDAVWSRYRWDEPTRASNTTGLPRHQIW